MYQSALWSYICQQACRSDGQQHEQQNSGRGRVILSAGAQPAIQQHAALAQGRVVAAALRQALSSRPPAEHRPAVIALLLPRCLEYVICSLACLAAGAAFLPLDPQWPPDRLQQVLASAQPDVLLYSSATADLAHSTGQLGADEQLCHLLLFDAACTQGQALLQQQSTTTDTSVPKQQQRQKQALPYFCVLYTSGSTGSPQGVMCTEQGFLNRYSWMQEQPSASQDTQQQDTHEHQHPQKQHPQKQHPQKQHPQRQQQAHSGCVALRPGHVVAFKTATTFVDHLWELLAPFLSGADMLLVPDALPASSSSSSGPPAVAALVPPGGAADGSWLPADAAAPVQSPGSAASGAAAAAGTMLQPQVLLDLLAEAEVTHLVAVPSVLELWLPQLLQHRGRLRLQQLVSSGEGLTAALAGQLLDALPDGCVLLNLYGSTEVSADATCQAVTHQLLASCGRWVPAGAPISNMAVAVLPAAVAVAADGAEASADAAAAAEAATVAAAAAAAESGAASAAAAGGGGGSSAAGGNADCGTQACKQFLHPLPVGQAGEIWVTGVGVAAGYLPASPAAGALTGSSSSSKSSSQFQLAQLSLQGGFGQQQQQLAVAVGPGWVLADVAAEPRVWCRMGDLGCITPDGVLHLTGRCSHTVKVRGVRVDVLEVEQALRQHPLLAEAAVAAWPHPQRPQDSVLAAYIVLQPAWQHRQQQQQDWRQQLRQHAASKLPAAAQPAVYVTLTHLPRSAAGKVLRSQLPPPPPAALAGIGGEQAQQQEQPQHGQGQLQERASDSSRFSETAVMRAMLATLPYCPTGVVAASDSSYDGMAVHAQLGAGAVAGQPAGTALPPPPPAAKAGGAAAEAAGGPQRQPTGAGPHLEPTDDFFTAWGGDSLAAAAVAATLGIDVRLVVAYPTPRALSAFLRRHSGSTSSSISSIGGGGGVKSRPAADVQVEQQYAAQQELPRGEAVQAAVKRPRLLELPVLPQAQQQQQQQQQGHGFVTPLHAAPNGQHLAAPQSIQAMLSASAVAVVVGPAGRVLRWQLHSWQPPQQSQGQQQAVAAAAASAPAGIVQQQQFGHQEEGFTLHWRVPMGRCVDAAPLLLALLQPAAPPGSNDRHTAGTAAAAAAGAECQRGMNPAVAASTSAGAAAGVAAEELVGVLAFACSHSGQVKCVDVMTGSAHWSAALPSRADVGMCTSSCGTRLAVPAGDGRLYCLRTLDGVCLGSVDCGAEVRRPPVCDPWWGLWWAVTHGKELVVVRPDTLLVAVRLPLPAVGSAELAFGCIKGDNFTHPAGGSKQQQQQQQQQQAQRQCVAVCGLLSGTMVCVAAAQAQPSAAADSAHALTSSAHRDIQQMSLSVLWQCQGSAPIFSGPVISQQQGCVVWATVDGTLTATCLQSGQQLWRVALPQGQQVFADLLLQPLSRSVPQAARASLSADGAAAGAELQFKPPLLLLQQQQQQGLSKAGAGVQEQGQQVPGSSRVGVLVATKSGSVFVLDASSGAQVQKVDLGGSGISAAPAPVLSLQQLAHFRSSSSSGGSVGAAAGGVHVVACGTDGTAHLLALSSEQQEEAPSVGAAVEGSVVLPGEVFSSPVSFGPWVVLGCRDDYLYCLTTCPTTIV